MGVGGNIIREATEMRQSSILVNFREQQLILLFVLFIPLVCPIRLLGSNLPYLPFHAEEKLNKQSIPSLKTFAL
jgi:hypothetical protein